ncbi:hypothetical protein STXM2123_2432 [Streptomyces sp. F-3]|nr:hypothetical protein STXM2123_2432 [Streptomyces sp. F-3]
MVSDSLSVRETVSPSGTANPDVRDDSPSPVRTAGTGWTRVAENPSGALDALFVPFDRGVRSSASVTGQRSLNDTFRPRRRRLRTRPGRLHRIRPDIRGSARARGHPPCADPPCGRAWSRAKQEQAAPARGRVVRPENVGRLSGRHAPGNA